MSPPVLAVALSGGPDSWALALRIRPAFAFIVDHGLRPESAQEAESVRAQAVAFGLDAHVLKWTGPKPATGLMEAARTARYALLLEACHRHGCTHLLIGHHQDDQIETVLMRRARGSGWRGLAGMPGAARRAGVTLVRPLLDTPKSALVEYCRAAGVPVVADPTNRNPAFTRSRVRLDLEQDLTPARRADLLAGIAEHAGRRQAELARLQIRLADHGTLAAGGSLCLDPHDVFEGDEGLFFLTSLLRLVGQHPAPPTTQAVVSLRARIATATGATLAGCRLWRQGARLWMVREAAAIPPLDMAPGAHDLLWDRRVRLRWTATEAMRLGSLGAGPWRHLPESSGVADLPGVVRAALPVLSRAGQNVALLTGESVPFWDPFRQKFGPIGGLGFLSGRETV